MSTQSLETITATTGTMQGNVEKENTADEHKEDLSATEEQGETRKRTLTEKGKEEQVRRLKGKQIAALSAVSRKRTELTRLMADETNLHLVKTELSNVNALFEQFQQACDLHYNALSSEEEQDRESQKYDNKEKSFLEFREQVTHWIMQTEHHLTDQVDHLSHTGSRVSRASSKSRASSTASARAREKAKVAELLAEKAMLKRKQALLAAEEELKLELAIAKARAREKTYAEMEEVHKRQNGGDCINPLPSPSADPYELPFPSAYPPPGMTSPAPATPALGDFGSVSSVSEHLDLPRQSTAAVTVLNPATTEFLPVDGSSSKSQAHHTTNNNAPRNTDANSNCSVINGQTIQAILTMQQQQNQQVITTHQQLAAAMTLPQPEVPTFRGDPINYKTFIMAFTARVESKITSNADRLYYLEQHVQGEPKELIGGCLHLDPEEGYKEARRLLEKEYGDPYKISIAFVNKALSWTPVKNDAAALKRFSFFLTKCKNAMKNISHMVVLNHSPNMQIIVQKLPPNLQNKWCDLVTKKRTKSQKIADFEDLVEFVESVAESANDPIFGRNALHSTEERPRFSRTDSNKTPFKAKPNSTSFATRVDVPSNPRPSVPGQSHGQRNADGRSCPLCSKSHDLDDCESFIKKTIEERKTFLKENAMCFACYGSNHISKGCTKKRTCRKCSKRHPTALHIDGFKLNKKGGTDGNGAATVAAAAASREATKVYSNYVDIPQNSFNRPDAIEETVVLHAIVPVKVKQKDSNRAVTTYAFYDSGSGGCFATESIKSQLGAEGARTRLQLGTMHGQSYVDSTALSGLTVTDLHGRNPVELPRTFTRDEIPVSHQQIPTPEIISRWKHLLKVSKEISEHRPDLEIGLLIGSNCPAALEPLEVMPSQGDGPFAVRLKHGWTVSGPLRVSYKPDKDVLTANRITVREVETIKEIVTPKALLNMLELDFNDRTPSKGPDERGYSQEDQVFLHKVEWGITKIEGHHQIPLPFRSSNLQMPNNRYQAVKRAMWQKKKMLRDEKYHRDYTTFVDGIIDKGYAQKITEDMQPTQLGKFWYLPHHGVYHPKKPGKIRVVFDCSAKFSGESLNDQLLQGPDLTNSLVGVLIRFRQEPVAFMGDVEAMFHQVKVPAEHCDFLRFLWWPGGNLDGELAEYRMTAHLFGAVSSPSCANYALKRTAKEGETEYGTLAADTLRRNFYVDDCLKSVSTEYVATKLIKDVRQMCAEGGFHLTKFICNRRTVLESIPEEERSKELKTLDLDRDELPIERALGVQWCVESDSFGFRITVNDKPLTRRGILSTVSSIYDPLGFAAPFTLPAKKLLQDLCREENLGWDDEAPETYLTRWAKWRSELPLLEQLCVDRCLKPPQLGQIKSRQIHVFSDASSTGYGAVAYLRLLDDRDHIHCSFLMGKARLASVKAVTIPRLELTAATVAVRLAQMLKKELDEEPDDIIFHTDSTTVLRYIANDQKRFQVFVANRVQMIRDFSSPAQWRYVDTKDNPADDASRGMDGPTLLNQQRWFNGPAFLWRPEKEWPGQPFTMGEVPDNDPEVKRVVFTSATAIDDSPSTVSKLIEHYSNWYRLKKAVAVFLRVQKTLWKRRADRKRADSEVSSTETQPEKRQPDLQRSPLNVQDLEEAEIAIFRFLQSQAFSDEIHALNRVSKDKWDQENHKKTGIKKTSRLLGLDPYLDQSVLRVGGRLRRASIPAETKHPVILPRKSHVTTLIIQHIHEELGHAGRGHVLARLRERYWVLGANAAVRSIISKCVSCRRKQALPSQQKMADLPKNRVTPAPPFTYSGVDYFGPFLVKEGRKEVKRYGSIFTCLGSRAVHIETACSLDTDSFLHALRRFIARRGPVREIRCDNGTNFVGAARELKQAMEEMDHSQIRDKLCSQGTDWIFNPSAASHMGGVWERQIRTVRKVLSSLLQEHGSRLDDESFRTLLCEVEAIVNSRPLTFTSSDPDDPNPLTPNHLLTMKTSIILPPPGNFQRSDVYMRRRWRRVQYLANLFWTRWKKEYLVTLQKRQKWNQPQRNLEVGDVVLMKDDNAARNDWPMGVITATEPDAEGFVRSAVVKTQNTELRRPVSKLILLLANAKDGSECHQDAVQEDTQT